ncbi:protein-disulfide reductase DsbD N-terminal domain-containing protein [Mariniblastus sp.]|nr:protein-disulfide reductase DsbD N-terminal domain-containing protein [Mariniblastus sp.]
MTRFFLLLFLLVATIPTVHLQAAPVENPVSITTELVANEKDSNQFTLMVSLDIQDGWHTYDDSKNSSINTTVDLELPDGAKQVGEWDRPLSKSKDGSPEKEVFTGQANFSCEIAVSEDMIGQKIEVTVSYQACNDQYCNRPTSKTLSVEIKDSPAAKKTVLNNASKNGSSAKVAPAEKKTARKGARKKSSKEQNSNKVVFENELFEAPVRLMSDGKPLEARDPFPSPAIYDIDGDGVNEMTVGGLRGNLEVFEDSNKSGKGEPIWKSRGSLKDSDGNRIKLTNW